MLAVAECLKQSDWDAAAQGIARLKNRELRRARFKHGNTLLHALLALHAPAALVAAVLGRKPPLNAVNAMRQTPLTAAVHFRAPFECVQLLLDQKADVNVGRGAAGESALHGAWYDVELCRALVARGADLHAEDSLGFTPLHAATKHRALDVMRLLLDENADPNAAGVSGVTPLHVASMFGLADAVLLLVERGADVERATERGYTAWTFGVELGYDEVCHVLDSLTL